MEPTNNKPNNAYPLPNRNKETTKKPVTSVQGPLEKLLREYHVQVDRLLDRIEAASTHYEVLGLKLAASYGEIIRAYYVVMNLIYPAQQIRIALDEKLLERLDNAFVKASGAFATLANFRKRADYHNTVLQKPTGSLPISSSQPANPTRTENGAQSTPQTVNNTRPVAPAVSPVTTPITPVTNAMPPNVENSSHHPETKAASQAANMKQPSTESRPKEQADFDDYAREPKDGNRRRSKRFKLTIPVRITGYDKNGAKWQETSDSIDVSSTGVTVYLRRKVRHGNVFCLSLSLPVNLRSEAFTNSMYNVYAIVRRVEPERRGQRLIALEFLGENPPPGFLEKPWSTFQVSRWSGIERRRWPRVNRQERVRLEYFDSTATMIGKEEAITENVGATGMRLFVKNAPAEFDIVRITCISRAFESLALIRNRYVAKDGMERVCVQFVKRPEA